MRLALVLLAVPLLAQQPTNISQYGGTSTTLGQKTMASSEPVTLASDQVLPTGPPGLVGVPFFGTATSSKTTTTLLNSGNPTNRGDTAIVACAGSNYASSNWTATVTDTQLNTYTQDIIANQSTTQFVAIFRSQGIKGGSSADTITLTIAGSNSANESLLCTAYELAGWWEPATALDQTNSGSNAGSTSPSAGTITPTFSKEFAVAVMAAGTTSSPTYTGQSGWYVDTTGAITSLTYATQYVMLTSPAASLATTGTLTASNAWAMAVASYKAYTPTTFVVPSGTFETATITEASTTNSASTSYLTSAASTNSTNVKNAAGNVYGIYIINTTTTNYFLRMYNLSSAPTCSSATGFVETIPALGASSNGGGISRFQVAQGYSTGIGFCLTGGGSSTDNTNAATGVYVTILYK